LKVFSSFLVSASVLLAAQTSARAQLLGTEFDLFEQNQRVEIFQELCHAMSVNYALWNLKESRIGVSPNVLCADAIARERAMPNPLAEPFAQAVANLEFMDRVLLFAASLHDSHLYLAPTVSRTRIRVPLQLAEIRGKIVVVSVETPLLRLLAPNSAQVSGIDVGDEIVNVNGVEAHAAATELLPWIEDSSAQGARDHAVGALVSRSFKFPETPVLKLGVRKALKKVAVAAPADPAAAPAKPEKPKEFVAEIPWVYEATNRADEREFFHRLGYYNPIGNLHKQWDAKKSQWVSSPGWSHGYSDSSLLQNLKDTTVILGNDFSTAAVGGVYEENGKRVAVLQIRGFPMKARVSGNHMMMMGQDFAESVSDLLEELQKRKLPLIVDLRHNFGGVLNQATEVARIFIPEGTTLPSYTEALPLTHMTRQLNEMVSTPRAFVSEDSLPNGKVPEISPLEVTALIKLAASARTPLTSAFVREDLEGSGDKESLARGVAVLITPECISACDVLAGLLKRAGAGIFIGTETDGTGSGYISGGNVNGSWKDHYSSFQGMFSTFLFGTATGTLGQRVYPGEADAMCSEQKPVRVDPGFEYTPELQADIVEGDRGWMRQAIAAIEAQAAGPDIP
jgi:hypothetical protein